MLWRWVACWYGHRHKFLPATVARLLPTSASPDVRLEILQQARRQNRGGLTPLWTDCVALPLLQPDSTWGTSIHAQCQPRRGLAWPVA